MYLPDDLFALQKQTSLSEEGRSVDSVCVLFLLLLSLAGIFSVSIARREWTRKKLYRDFAELDARTLLLDLKLALVSQITQKGGFNLGSGHPQEREFG